MPNYLTQCNKCGHEDHEMRSVDDRNKNGHCQQEGCDGETVRQFEASINFVSHGGGAVPMKTRGVDKTHEAWTKHVESAREKEDKFRTE